MNIVDETTAQEKTSDHLPEFIDPPALQTAAGGERTEDRDEKLRQNKRRSADSETVDTRVPDEMVDRGIKVMKKALERVLLIDDEKEDIAT